MFYKILAWLHVLLNNHDSTILECYDDKTDEVVCYICQTCRDKYGNKANIKKYFPECIVCGYDEYMNDANVWSRKIVQEKAEIIYDCPKCNNFIKYLI